MMLVYVSLCFITDSFDIQVDDAGDDNESFVVGRLCLCVCVCVCLCSDDNLMAFDVGI